MGVHSRLDDLDVASARLFLTVAELGSVSKAASRHGLTQPSATARLQKLERQLGVQLLERGPTGSVLTDDGQQVSAWCASLVAAAVTLTDGARALTEQRAPTLRIATTAGIARHHLLPWIPSAGLVDVEIQLLERVTATVAELVRSGEAALGFLAGPGAPLGLRSEVVRVDELVPVVHPEHAWARRRRGVTGAELAAGRLILRSRGSGTLDVVEAALAQHELGVTGDIHEVTSDVGARLAAVNHAGAAILPLPEVQPDLVAGRLVAVKLRGIELRQPIRVAWKGTRPARAAARQALAHIGGLR